MAQTIPISQIVEILPGVVDTGSNPLALNGLFLTENAVSPSGYVQSFPSVDSVADYFGIDSREYALAVVYFSGFDNATKYPGAMKFTRFSSDALDSFVVGLPVSGIPKTTGDVTVTYVDVTSTVNVDLSDAVNYQDSATALQTALRTVTGLENATATWDAVFSRYVVSTGETTAGNNLTAITGSVSDAFGLTGGTYSKASDAQTLTGVLNDAKQLDLNFASIATVFECTNDQHTEISVWANGQNSRYVYIASDDNQAALSPGNAQCFGNIAKAAEYDGVVVIYDATDSGLLRAFVAGTIASIDWKRVNGRITFAFKSQGGLPPTVDTLANATALLGNGYSYYGAYSASGPDNTYNFFYDGNLPGKFRWLDTFVNQVYLNSQLQKAVIDLLVGVNSLPYNNAGYTMLRAACLDPINEGINNGSIRNGVNLSSNQKAKITAKVGFDISRELYTEGWYLLIQDADAQTRGQRQSPPMIFMYCDGGSIHQITLPSIVIL